MNHVESVLSIIIVTIIHFFLKLVMSVTIPILVVQIAQYNSSPFFVMMLIYPILTLIFYVWYMQTRTVNMGLGHFSFEWKEKKMFILTGFFEALSMVLLIFSSDINKTPIVLQASLLPLSHFVSIMVSKYLINFNRHIKLVNGYTMTSFILLLSTYIVALACHYNNTYFAWSIVFGLAIISKGIMEGLNIYYIQEFGVHDDHEMAPKLTMKVWSNLSATGFIYAMYIFDFIPKVGYSEFKTFGDSFVTFFEKLVRPDQDFLFTFVIVYFVSYFSSFGFSYLSEKNKFNVFGGIIGDALLCPGFITFFLLFTTIDDVKTHQHFASFNYEYDYQWYIKLLIIIMNFLGMFVFGVWEKIVLNPEDSLPLIINTEKVISGTQNAFGMLWEYV
jgi:hypothetical protein